MRSAPNTYNPDSHLAIDPRPARLLTQVQAEIIGLLMETASQKESALVLRTGPRGGALGYEMKDLKISCDVRNTLVNRDYLTKDGRVTDKGIQAWHEWNWRQKR